MEYHNLNNQVVKESLEVEATSSFDPTQRLKSGSPVKDSNKDSEKLALADGGSSGSMATSTRKALKIEVKRGSQSDSLLKNDFAKKPFKDESNKKLDASGEFGDNKAWKPLLTTEQIKDNRGMGAFSNSHTFSASSTSSTPPTFSNIGVGVKSDITKHLNKENTRWVFIPNSSPDIWTGAGYRKANNNNNGIPFDSVKPSNNNQQFNPSSMENQVTSGNSSAKKTTYDALPNSISPTSDWSNALTFTNKNNPQRNQLLLRALLGTIPVLINKSGDSNDQFNKDSDQKWDKTETKEGNLPGFGEVNGASYKIFTYLIIKKSVRFF